MVSPLILCQHLMGRMVGPDRTLEGLSQLLSLIPGGCGSILRCAFYSRVLIRCDWSVFIGFGALLSKVDTQLGEHVYIGPYCQLGWVSIGSDTLLGPSVQVPSGQKSHTFERLDIPIRNQPRDSSRIEIGKECWIGAGSIAMADVGDQSVIGAGTVVTRSIGARELAAGAPCKRIRSRCSEG